MRLSEEQDVVVIEHNAELASRIQSQLDVLTAVTLGNVGHGFGSVVPAGITVLVLFTRGYWR